MPKRQTIPERARKVAGSARSTEVEPTHDERQTAPDQIDQALAQAHDRARERSGADD